MWAADHAPRELYVGWPTVKAIVGNKIAAGYADRRLATIGYERQLAGNMAFSADYIHMNMRELYMRKDLNAGLRTSTSRTAAIVRPNPNFSAQVLELVNTGWADYDALQLSLQKRFSRGHSYRVSYTRSRSFGNVVSPGNVETIAYQVQDQLNLEQGEGLTGQDRPHILSIDGSLEVPRTRGMLVSGVVQYNSGTPFTLVDSNSDPDRNGQFQEPLPAGTYSGTGPNGFTVDNKGGVRGARGPDYFLLNLRAGYRFRLPHNRSLQAHIDVFNVTNRANFTNPINNNSTPFAGADRRLATFLMLDSILNGGPTRTAQLNLKYTF